MKQTLDFKTEPGYIYTTDDSGNRSRHSIASILRSADIPDLTIDSLTLLTKLAELVTILIKTLIERDILDESFEDDYDLQYIVETLENDLSVTW